MTISNLPAVNQPSAIVYRYGDMFQQYDRGVMFVPVNCKGVMGAGLALKVAQRNPGLELLYRDLCRTNFLGIGRPYLMRTVDGTIISLFPTKDDWRNPSKLEYIETGFQYFIKDNKPVIPLHIPKLGCGLGGLEWDDVHALIKKYFADYPQPVYVYI